LGSAKDDENQGHAVPGRANISGVKRKLRTYKSLSSKPNGKRPRLVQHAGRVSAISPSPSSPLPFPGSFRVLALWKGDGHYYCASIRTVHKAGKYTVEYDDGDEATVALSNLRTFLQVGDVLEVLRNPHTKGGMATVTVVRDTHSQSRATITVKLRDDEVITVDSKYLRVPKDVPWKGNRRISPDSVLVPILTPGTTRRRPQTRAKSGTMGFSQPPFHPAVRQTPGYRETTVKSNSQARSLAKSVKPDTSMVQGSHPAFAETIVITTQIPPASKLDLLSKIRRAGGKIVEDWDDILSFGSGWADIRWRNISNGGKFDQILLLSPDSAQTPKYMMALALGVPCVSDQWAWDQLCGVRDALLYPLSLY
jgi:DNA repair protein Crb2 Tudor domain